MLLFCTYGVTQAGTERLELRQGPQQQYCCTSILGIGGKKDPWGTLERGLEGSLAGSLGGARGSSSKGPDGSPQNPQAIFPGRCEQALGRPRAYRAHTIYRWNLFPRIPRAYQWPRFGGFVAHQYALTTITIVCIRGVSWT